MSNPYNLPEAHASINFDDEKFGYLSVFGRAFPKGYIDGTPNIVVSCNDIVCPGYCEYREGQLELNRDTSEELLEAWDNISDVIDNAELNNKDDVLHLFDELHTQFGMEWVINFDGYWHGKPTEPRTPTLTIKQRQLAWRLRQETGLNWYPKTAQGLNKFVQKANRMRNNEKAA